MAFTESDKAVAVMQPYLFPYVGYFQLIAAADVFVFYDDVDFIKQGWINRNKILINGNPQTFTVPCHNASSNETINDVIIHEDWRSDKLLKKIRMTYANANNFDTAFPIVEGVIEDASDRVSNLAEQSVRRVSEYLNLNISFHRSSDLPVDESLGRADRLIEMTKHFDAAKYINMEGGKNLYDKPYFADQGIELYFLSPKLPEYTQYTSRDGNFHPGLSIIDLMMNVNREEVRVMLESYQLD